jgi:hypothetical protein
LGGKVRSPRGAAISIGIRHRLDHFQVSHADFRRPLGAVVIGVSVR